jgi:hypothetical protein
MKMIWESRQDSQQAGAGHMHLVIWDFLKMLATAVLCGLAVSIAAAGITLLLTGSAEARRFQKEPATTAAPRAVEIEDIENDDLSPTPGTLLLGDGCDSLALTAIERDWQVRIDGKRVEVRVMQTFQLPADSTEVATFHVQLIKGARMQSLAAQSSTNDWAGDLISTDAYDRLTPAEYLSLSRNRILASHSLQGTVMTSPMLGLKSEEAITIEYTYVMTLDDVNGSSALVLPLEADGDYAVNGRAPVDSDRASPTSLMSPPGSATKPAVRGAVWVEWIGSKPSRVMGLPAEADLEISKSRIEGFSWATREIQPGARFQLSWEL